MEILHANESSTVFYVVTSKGRFGPYQTRSLAEAASFTVPKNETEVPQVEQKTQDGKDILFG